MKSYTYYLSSNTSEGYVSFFDEEVKEFKKIIVLKNISSLFKEELFTNLKVKLLSLDLDFDTILRPGTISEINAIIIPSLSTAVSVFEMYSKEIPLYADVIDFADKPHFDSDLSCSITDAGNDILLLKNKMYNHLKNAKRIHDDIEKIYISNMDFERANNEINTLISNIFNSVRGKKDNALITRRFFGTLHPHKNINYIDELTSGLEKRIFINGRPGSGKSTCLKKVASVACENGYNVEKYCCSLDPQSLDMVIVRELGLCLFDCTEPHKKVPVASGDEEFDIYNLSTNTDVDTVYSDEIMYNQNMYNIELKKAKECLYSAFIRERNLDKILSENNRDELKTRAINMVLP